MFSKRFEEVKKFLPAILVVALVIAGFSVWSAKTDGNCVTVSIDYGVLDAQNPNYEKCLPNNGEVTALDLMKSANFEIEGTQKYGDQIVANIELHSSIAKGLKATFVRGVFCRIGTIRTQNVADHLGQDAHCYSNQDKQKNWQILIKVHVLSLIQLTV